ncbi:MAG: capsule biosynthesis protein [Alphaproteobacteria bacterium]|nr:capsule biosynthesis protein [Alphaproteobacteria bacterium]
MPERSDLTSPAIHETRMPVIEEIELTAIESQGELVPYATAESSPSIKIYRIPIWRWWDDFPIFVGLPILVALIYQFLIAANYYSSEAQFVIRTNSGGSALGGITSLIQSQGLSRATDETYAVNDYLQSRDMVRDLVEQDHLREVLQRPESDFITRFPNFYREDNFEQLYKHFQHWIKIELDDGTGITTIRADAYRPEDAHALLSAMLRHAEELINKMNIRAHDDAVQYANVFVQRASEQAADVEARLTDFRNKNKTVDPSHESDAMLRAITQMSTELARLEAMLKQETALTPSSPVIPSLQQRILSYQSEIEKLRGKIVGGEKSTASVMATYEGLILERELAAKSLEAAVANLNQANQEARQQHLYLETIAKPHVPDSPEFWRRMLFIGAVTAASAGLWFIYHSFRRNDPEYG